MNKQVVSSAVYISIFSLGLVGGADAALFGRLPASPGGTDYQAYYDDVLDITWLADANLAASNTFGLPYNMDLGDHPNDSYAATYTELIYSDGRMNWGGALHWIDAMNAYGGAGYLGFNDWRLPTMMDTGTGGCDYSTNGTDCGYNVQTGSVATTVYSEMASLWYDTLGNTAAFDIAGNPTGCGFSCLTNAGPFSNIQSWYYWTGIEYAPSVGDAWGFYATTGFQFNLSKDYPLYGWAVRSGDVSAVPVPSAAWLFVSGLLSILGVKRSRRFLR